MKCLPLKSDWTILWTLAPLGRFFPWIYSFESTGPFGQFFLNFFVKSPRTNNLLWETLRRYRSFWNGKMQPHSAKTFKTFVQSIPLNRQKTGPLASLFHSPSWMTFITAVRTVRFVSFWLVLFLFIFKIPQISTNPQNSLYRQTTDIYFQKICFENKNGNNCNRIIFCFFAILWALNFVNLLNFSLQIVKIFIKI